MPCLKLFLGKVRKQIMEQKVILVDSRQQANKVHHKLKNKYFQQQGYLVNRVAINTGGDYQFPNGNIGIDTKQNILELINDIQVKTWTKKQISEAIQNLGFSGSDYDELLDLVWGDDENRFVEHEISQWCFNHGCEEMTNKVKDLYVKRRGFFHRGLVRTKFYGTKLVVLVENDDGITSIKDLFKWVNPRSKMMVWDKSQIVGYRNSRPIYAKKKKFPYAMNGEQLAKACLTMEKKYGCKFMFCKPVEAGQMILDILNEKISID